MGKTVTILSSEESFENNYGAALQGQALYATLQELGCEPQFVRYSGNEFDKSYLRYLAFYVKWIGGRVYHAVFPNSKDAKHRRLQRQFRTQIKAREAIFKRFSKENMAFWNKKRVGWYSLKRKHPVTDIYICGSDQIWNPHFKRGRNDPGYFLAFAPKGAKKIAYAPSFGCSDLPPKAKEDIKELLADYHAISVREESGIDIVRKYADREAKLVLDPTMLRTPEQWKALAGLPEGIPKKYILCYRFAESEHTKETIRQMSQELGLPVISLPLSDEGMKDTEFTSVFAAGPKEFVGLIQNAALVCTDSFHATVFSVLMKTPVCVFLRESYQGGNSMNSRVNSLLKMLQLEHLIVTSEDTAAKARTAMQEDYTVAHQILTQRREESMAYLQDALKG